jgi:hypothetical protein
LGAAIGGVIAGFSFYKINQKQLNLLRMNLAEAKSRNNAIQREMDMLAEENLAARALKETVEEKDEQEL